MRVEMGKKRVMKYDEKLKKIKGVRYYRIRNKKIGKKLRKILEKQYIWIIKIESGSKMSSKAIWESYNNET